MSGVCFAVARLKRNIAAVVSGMWDTIYNQSKNKEKQWTEPKFQSTFLNNLATRKTKANKINTFEIYE